MAFPDSRRAIEGVEHAGILNRRSQPGRYPLYRSGLADDLIDVIAIDALKRAQLESDAEGLIRVRTIGPRHLRQVWD